jgi:anti-anti-sigma factor
MTFATDLVKRSSSTAVIVCRGEIDIGTCAKLIDAIERACEPGLEVLRVDMRDVTLIDSTGMGCLIHGYLGCKRAGIRFEVVPSPALLNSPLANQLPRVAWNVDRAGPPEGAGAAGPAPEPSFDEGSKQ